MEIRDVGNVARVNNDSKINKASVRKDVDSKAPVDNVQISDEAKVKAEMSRVQELVNNSPDVRQDRIDEVKAKLDRGDYNNDEVMNKVAEKLMKVLGF
jgi:negative regulator of flagellin synthesis FlgM